jgi:uncharacterized DUF497 family protein
MPLMDYEWDAKKASSNLSKHKIDFADAVGVFSDPLAITIRDDDSEEERFVTIGADFLLRVVVVVYTWREERIRMISARKANSSERKIYEKQQ